jgi:hypothetical protein
MIIGEGLWAKVDILSIEKRGVKTGEGGMVVILGGNGLSWLVVDVVDKYSKAGRIVGYLIYKYGY